MNFKPLTGRTIATICARGGSKGLPGKNIRPFAGRPLIAHTISQALQCAEIDAVYVSTDDVEIAAVARTAGAIVPCMRPPELAADDAAKLPVIEHLVSFLESQGEKIERIVDLQPTSPLRDSADISAALRTRPDAQLVVSVSEAPDSPYFNLVEQDAGGWLHLSKGQGSARRQDVPAVYALNGAIYVWQRAALTHASVQGLWSVQAAPFVMPRWKSVDIDTLEDFDHAQWLAQRRNAGPASATSPVFVIAEAGVNHNGDLSMALSLCDAARAAGADAVKFQTFRAEDLVVPGAPTAQYQAQETGQQDQFALLQKLELSLGQHQAIQAHCKKIGIEFFSTPFSVPALHMLVGLGVARIKLSSGELTHRELVERAAATRLPLLVSAGMATMEEIREALRWIAAARGDLKGVTVLHCTSAYPAPDSALNLNAIASMRRDLGLPIGYSDHSHGSEAAVAAVALGATVIEKHLTLDRNLPGPDHKASLEPDQFKQMMQAIRRVESMLGDGVKAPGPEEADTTRVARRSVVAVVDIAPGALIEPSMLACRRPATGIAPRDLNAVVGRTARVRIAAGSVLNWNQLEGGERP
jgi:N,N'-diacetyllegionaminate synthase